MKKIVIGLVIGIIISSVAWVLTMPKIILKEQVSPLGFKETIKALEDAVTEGGWIILDKVDLQNAMDKTDKNIPKSVVMKICEPHMVSTIMNDDEGMIGSVIMPCTISVYEKKDGRSYVATVNTRLLGRIFGGTVSKVVSGSVTDDTKAFLAFLDQKAK